MAENSKNANNKMVQITELLKKYWYLVPISVITIYHLQYYLVYAFFIITYPFTTLIYIIYWIVSSLVSVVWYLITVIFITLFTVIQYTITSLIYTLYFIISTLINFAINVFTITISLLLIIGIVVYILAQDEITPKHEEKKVELKVVTQKKKVEEKKELEVIKEVVYFPDDRQRFWKVPSIRCTCSKLSDTKLTEIHPIGETKDEYVLITHLLETTRRSHPQENITGYCIKKIESINNCCLWTKYKNRTQDISRETNPMSTNVCMLFHATLAAEKVLEKGFDERFSNKEGMFGAGVYFAQHSSKSNQYAVGKSFAKPCQPHGSRNCPRCIRTMFLCRVTLGKPYKLTIAEKMSHPPPGYHSVEGVPTLNGLRYPEFVVYRGEQAYPEYKITYTINN